MNKITMTLIVSLLLISMMAACGGSEDSEKAAAGDVVRAAANAYVKGYNNRDLTQFDTFFAPPGDQYGMADTFDAAHQLMDDAAPGDTFQIDKLEIQDVQLDDTREEAVVTYYAEVSRSENGEGPFTAVVTQDVALQKIDGFWLITGGDAANVAPGFGAQDS